MSRIISRRTTVKSAGALAASALLPSFAHAAPTEMQAAIKNMFGDGPLNTSRVSLKIPPISENGYSVPIDIDVDSPMQPDNYVKRIAIFSERNPIPLIATYHLTPRSGRARVTGRIRLGGTQSVHAIAEMSGGRLYTASARTLVTIAACVIL